MNTQDQMNHIKELIQFLEIQNKGLNHWAKHRNTTWLTTVIDRLKTHAQSTTGVEPLKSTIAFQNEFRSFLTTWFKRAQANTSKQTNAGLDNEVHNQQKSSLASIYVSSSVSTKSSWKLWTTNHHRKQNMTTKSLLIPGSAILTNIAKTDLEKINSVLDSSNVEVQTIYHKDCLDGSVSAFVAWLKLDTHQPVGVSYADSLATQLLQSKERCTLLFVDFSWNPEVLIELANHGHNVIVVDHHTSAIDKIMAVPKNDVNFWYFLASEKLAVEDNQKHSGCSLAMEFFKYIEAPEENGVDDPEGLTRLVSLTREHDLWLHNGDPASDAMALAYWHKNKSFDDLRTIWNQTDLSVATVNAMVAEGRVHLGKAVSEINEVIKCGCLVQIGGNRAWLFYCERAYTSLAGSIVNQQYDIAISFYREGDKFKMSVRTAKDSYADASKLAGIYGGGGHQHAAGFYTDVYPAVLLKRSPPQPVALAPNVVINPNQA